MTKSITISGVVTATDAAAWCKVNIKGDWDIKMLEQDMFSGNYTFEFQDPCEASFFAIRWR